MQSKQNKLPKWTEKQLCKAFYNQALTRMLYNQFPKRLFIFHVANEQNTSKAYTMELKRMGLRSGVADYCVLIEGGKVAFIEFKRDAASAKKKNDNQAAFKAECELLGISYLLTWNVDEAIEFLHAL